MTVTDASGLGYDDRSRDAPINAGAFTEAALLQDFIFSQATSGGDGGFDVTIDGLMPGGAYTLTAWSYDAVSSGLRTSDWTANGVSVEDYSFDGSSGTPPSNEIYRMGFVVTADSLGRIVLQGRQDEESSDYGVFLNALRLETGDTLSDPSGGVLRVDFNDDDDGESAAANTEIGYSTMTLEDNGATIDGVTITVSGYNGGVPDDRDRTDPIAGGAFTLDQVYDDFIFTPSRRGAGMEIFIEGLAPSLEYDLVLRSLDAFGSGTRQAAWTEVSGPAPITIAAPYSYDGAVPPTSNDDNTMRARLTTSPQGTLVLRGVQVGVDTSVFVNGLELSQSGFQEFVGVDVEASMAGVNSTAYVRAPFSAAEPAAIDRLYMDIRYDAGFVAYINGQEVARRNAPTPGGVAPAYDAAATLERTGSEALLPETIDLSAFKHLLTAGGGNVLAIHGLNIAAADEDFLIAPQLRAIELEAGSLRFFETPTPGAANGEGVIGLVAEVQMSVPHRFYNAPFSLNLATPTAGASVYYTYNGSVPEPGNPAAFLYTGPIQVSRTTVVRAGAVLDGYGGSSISTATYIFLDDVVDQTINPADPASNPFGLSYPGFWQGAYPADFNMDPRVTGRWGDDNPSNQDFSIRQALQSIPTMSIVMDHDDLWNVSTGIYPNALRRGDSWERAATFIEKF